MIRRRTISSNYDIPQTTRTFIIFFTLKLATSEKLNFYYLLIEMSFWLTFFAIWGEIYLEFRKFRRKKLLGQYRVGIGSDLDPGRNSPKLINHFPLIRFAYYGSISIKYVRKSGKNQFRPCFHLQGPFDVTFRTHLIFFRFLKRKYG